LPLGHAKTLIAFAGRRRSPSVGHLSLLPCMLSRNPVPPFAVLRPFGRLSRSPDRTSQHDASIAPRLALVIPPSLRHGGLRELLAAIPSAQCCTIVHVIERQVRGLAWDASAVDILRSLARVGRAEVSAGP
jgi:hypothetical protein